MDTVLDTGIMYSDSRRLSGGAGGDDLLYLFMFWAIAYVSAILAKMTKLSPLLFYLLFGAILINANILKHSTFLDVLAEVAITIVFFALGFEENVTNFLGGIKKSWGIASIGAIVPFGCGFFHAMFFWPDAGIKPQLMCGLAVTATAVSLTMIALKSEGLATSTASIGIMTSAVLDDVACLALVAVMVPVATGEAEPTVGGIAWVLGKCAIFFSVIVFLNMIVFPHDLSAVPVLKHVPFIRSLGVHHCLRFDSGEQAVVVSLLIGFGTGLIATAFGFHPAIGAYMAGLILEEKYFDLPALSTEDLEIAESEFPPAPPNVYHHVMELLENAAFCWIGPIFFIHLGSQIKVDVDIMKNVVAESLTLYILLFVGQVASAGLAARFVPGGFTWTESLMIGFGMLGRAELFFVVLNICYIENKIFTTEMFYSLTFAAMLLNITVPVTISLYKPYYVGDKVCCGRRKEAIEDGDDKPKRTESALVLTNWVHSKAMAPERRLLMRTRTVDIGLDLAVEARSGLTAHEVAERIYRTELDDDMFKASQDDVKEPSRQVSFDSKGISQVSPSTSIPRRQITTASRRSTGTNHACLPRHPLPASSFSRHDGKVPSLCGVTGCSGPPVCLVCLHIKNMLHSAQPLADQARLSRGDSAVPPTVPPTDSTVASGSLAKSAAMTISTSGNTPTGDSNSLWKSTAMTISTSGNTPIGAGTSMECSI